MHRHTHIHLKLHLKLYIMLMYINLFIRSVALMKNTLIPSCTPTYSCLNLHTWTCSHIYKYTLTYKWTHKFMFSQIQALTFAHSHAQNTNVFTLSLPHKEHTFSHTQASSHSLTEKNTYITYKHAYILINTHMMLYIHLTLHFHMYT